MAKSEPASRVHESVDGVQDSDVTAASSGEGQPMSQSSVMVNQSPLRPYLEALC